MGLSSKFFWGIDIGGSSVKIGHIQGSDFVLAESVPTGIDSTPEDVLEQVADVVLKTDTEPAGVGVGSAGLIDREAGVIRFSPNLPLWSGAGVSQILMTRLNSPVILDNDCNAFAIGALYSGEIPRQGLWLFLTLGTGIGGTIISEGSILYGTGASGEFGHMTVSRGGLPCTCGSDGCWEQYAGRNALEWYYYRLTGKHLPPLEISRLAGTGDLGAREAWREFGAWVGVGLAGLANCFAPMGFYLGGGLSAGLAHFGVPARQVYVSRCRHPWSVTLLDDSPEAGAFGAASMAMKAASC